MDVNSWAATQMFHAQQPTFDWRERVALFDRMTRRSRPWQSLDLGQLPQNPPRNLGQLSQNAMRRSCRHRKSHFRVQVRHRSYGSRPSSRDLRLAPRPVSVTTTTSAQIRRDQANSRVSLDDVISLADHTREVTSLENRRQVLQEAQRTVRHEALSGNVSRCHSVSGLQSVSSPLPLSAHRGRRSSQLDHIPVLLPLPSDRTFIPSPDQENGRHMTTPVDQSRSESVARQCCEIMHASTCRACRKLESRLLNREKAEKECPRMHTSHQNIAMTQIVKRLFPFMDEDEIQDKIARGQIGRSNFRPRYGLCRHHEREGYEGEEEDEDEDVDVGEEEGEAEEGEEEEEEARQARERRVFEQMTSQANKKPSGEKGATHTSFYVLAKLALRLGGEPSTPLFFSDLKRMQTKILHGEVERKSYMKPKRDLARLKSAVSSVSTASSGKSTLSKVGSRLAQSLMPTFVSPRKVKVIEEPKYKVFYEPPLLSRRKQIPNPSFFAGSTDEYLLPERLPDVIEFADSKRITMLERQMRSASSMSLASSMGEDNELNKSGSRTARSDRLGSAREGLDNGFESSRQTVDESGAQGEEQRSGGRQVKATRVNAERELADHAEEAEPEVHEAQGREVKGQEVSEAAGQVSHTAGQEVSEIAGQAESEKGEAESSPRSRSQNTPAPTPQSLTPRSPAPRAQSHRSPSSDIQVSPTDGESPSHVVSESCQSTPRDVSNMAAIEGEADETKFPLFMTEAEGTNMAEVLDDVDSDQERIAGIERKSGDNEIDEDNGEEEEGEEEEEEEGEEEEEEERVDAEETGEREGIEEGEGENEDAESEHEVLKEEYGDLYEDCASVGGAEEEREGNDVFGGEEDREDVSVGEEEREDTDDLRIAGTTGSHSVYSDDEYDEI